MEFASKQLKQIAVQMRGMSTSQRVAIGLLLIMLVGGMYGMISWGGQAEWTVLLNQDLTDEQIQKVQQELQLEGAESKVQGSRVLVKGGEAERVNLTAKLAQKAALPTDLSLGYAELIRSNNVFVGSEEAKRRWDRALEAELAKVISRFDGVENAQVFIEKPERRGFSVRESEVGSRASVFLTVADRQGPGPQVGVRIAEFVAGSVGGLKSQDVKITDQKGNLYGVPDPTSAIASGMLERQREIEEHNAAIIRENLKYIPGVLVAVNATLKPSDESMEEQIFSGEPFEKETNTVTEESRDGANAGEAGVRPNTRMELSGGGSGSESTREEASTVYSDDRNKKIVQLTTPRGTLERLAVSVKVPRSYLDMVIDKTKEIMKADPSAAQEDPAALLKKVEADQTKQIEDSVKTLIQAKDESQVAVNWFFDVPPQSMPAMAGAEPTTFLALVQQYGGQAGLGALVLISLLLVARMAMKAQSAMAGTRQKGTEIGADGIPVVGGVGSLVSLAGGPAAVGEAGDMAGILMGREVDERVVRTQQMIRQIAELVKNDPKAAAGLVERWVQYE